MKLQLAPKTLAAVLGAVIALLGIGGFLVLVGSQRSTAASLESQAADAQSNLAALQQTEHAAAAAKAAAKPHGKGKATKVVSQSTLLETAFPSTVEMPSILLQVEHLADASGVSLEAFAPALPLPLSGYESISIDVTVTGRYRQIQHFVRALRVQAGSTGGRVHAAGRLFAVETVGITAASEGAPALSATILLDAFVYSGIVPPVEGDTTTSTDGAVPTTPGGTS